MKKNILHIPPVFLFACMVIIIAMYFVFPEFNVIPFPYNLGGIAVSFAGFFIMGKAHEQFRKNRTTLAIKESSALITGGVFSFSRNPMYLGMFLLLLGMGIAFRNSFSLSAPFLFWLYLTVIVIPCEEQMMTKVFGDDYLKYRKNVGRWI